VFSVADRERVHSWVLALARSDPRVVGGAVVGSLARGTSDAWSDLDLLFAVTDDIPALDVLEDWSVALDREFQAVCLFDLPSGPITYRVFLLPNCLELDLAVTPASAFTDGGPSFQLVFGETVDRSLEAETSARELLGYAVHHTLHARVAIERGRIWLAEYWISALRDKGMHLACARRGLDGWYGRGFDELPDDVRSGFALAVVRSLDRDELDRALEAAVRGLLRESAEAPDLARAVERQLGELAGAESLRDPGRHEF
jgi:hypothetical protein